MQCRVEGPGGAFWSPLPNGRTELASLVSAGHLSALALRNWEVWRPFPRAFPQAEVVFGERCFPVPRADLDLSCSPGTGDPHYNAKLVPF